MHKHKELADPNSCLNRARDDERLFVLLERDAATASTIRFWAAKRIELGKNRPNDMKIIEALQMAHEIEALHS
jgi:hypothetical protein